MVSKPQMKLIRSLAQKKQRQKQGLFIVEGIKGINEFLKSSFELHQLYATIDLFDVENGLFTEISSAELKQISHLETPQDGLAIFKMPKHAETVQQTKIVALDSVRDPGNLGTIIRMCDWFGVERLICSRDTVDCYNPKVVQATMGSLSRVRVDYMELKDFLRKTSLPVFGTFMDGESIYETDLPKDYVLVLGNEANGISKDIEAFCKARIAIPQFGNSQSTESLNVATAAAISLAEFARQSIER